MKRKKMATRISENEGFLSLTKLVIQVSIIATLVYLFVCVFFSL